jgi:hypothetical protein
MITSIILTLVYYFIYAVISPLLLFADVSLPAAVSNAITTAGGYIGIFSVIIPAGDLLTIVALVISIEAVVFFYRIIRWIYNKIPGVS